MYRIQQLKYRHQFIIILINEIPLEIKTENIKTPLRMLKP